MERIAKLDTSHATELGRLNGQLIQDEGHSNPKSVAELTERMRGWLSGSYRCYGILNDAQILAYCLYRDDEHFYYVRQLFTDRDCRNRGLASRLLSFLEARVFVDKGVRLEVPDANHRAMRFYAARGYEAYCHTLVKDN